MSTQATTAWPPPNMQGFTALKSKPAPGVNSRYYELEAHRRCYAGLEKERTLHGVAQCHLASKYGKERLLVSVPCLY